MRKIINRIKYRLLVWLLGDICERCEECSKCRLGCESKLFNGWRECLEADVHIQARKVWGLED